MALGVERRRSGGVLQEEARTAAEERAMAAKSISVNHG